MTDIDLVKAVIDKNLTYLSLQKFESLLGSVDAIKANRVPGDFVEFGVALGGSGICLAKSLDRGRRFIGFDLFGTIPAPTERDGPVPNERYKTIAAGKSTGINGDQYYGYIPNLYDVVRKSFESFGCPIDDDRVKLMRGLFEDTLPKHGAVQIAFAHIDCDWFDPVTMCLEYIWPRLSVGGIIILDDYNDWDGCKKATDFFIEHNQGIEIVSLQPHAVIKKVGLKKNLFRQFIFK